MSTIPTPLWMQAVSGEAPIEYNAQQERALIDDSYATQGIIAPFMISSSGAGTGPLAVQQRGAGANMSVDVLAGACIVTGTNSSGQGKYLCPAPSTTVNVPLASAPPAGQSRWDVIVAQVTDAQNVGGTTSNWAPTVVTGTPATTGSQLVPAAPPSSLVLARVLVGPTVTQIVNSNITDLRVPAVPRQQLYGFGGIGVGAVGSYTGQPVLIQAGQISGTTNSVGALATVFPQAFPNGVLGVFIQSLSTSGTGVPLFIGTIVAGAVATNEFWSLWLIETSRSGGFAFYNNAAVNSGYIAFGF